jgi:16S rRNA (adenine1518-N6/adenine1519-N6)-dimethyltransferase
MREASGTFHSAKKSLGQNFLMHARIAERIADSADINGKAVLEIGPGTGMLTKPLLSHAKRVVAVEADAALAEKLLETFADEIKKGKLELITGDIREFDASKMREPYSLVANIPYYITGDIIRRFLEAEAKPESMTLLVQKEVAERIARAKKESILSISVKVFGAPKYLFTVPRGAFVPAPNVDSAVLRIADIRDPFGSKREEGRFFDIVRAGFAHKRKFLAGNLTEVAPKEAVLAAFSALSIPDKARAEDISLETWKNLARELA